MSTAMALLLLIFMGIPTPAEVKRAAQDALSDDGIQKELPGTTAYSDWTPPAPVEREDGNDAVDEFVWNEDDRREFRTTDFEGETRSDVPTAPRRGSGDTAGGGPALGNAVLWLILGVALVVAVTFITRALTGYTKDAREGPRPQKPPPVPRAALTRPKTEAERLADDGEYAQAIHVLLLETLRDLSRHVPGGIRNSHTSREVLRRIELPDSARPELEGLVSAVEASLFGYDVPDRARYESCVGHFRRFADAYAAAPRAGASA